MRFAGRSVARSVVSALSALSVVALAVVSALSVVVLVFVLTVSPLKASSPTTSATTTVPKTAPVSSVVPTVPATAATTTVLATAPVGSVVPTVPATAAITTALTAAAARSVIPTARQQEDYDYYLGRVNELEAEGQQLRRELRETMQTAVSVEGQVAELERQLREMAAEHARYKEYFRALHSLPQRSAQ